MSPLAFSVCSSPSASVTLLSLLAFVAFDTFAVSFVQLMELSL